jgi:hypothetical protein
MRIARRSRANVIPRGRDGAQEFIDGQHFMAEGGVGKLNRRRLVADEISSDAEISSVRKINCD